MGCFFHVLLKDPLTVVTLAMFPPELIERTAKLANGAVAHIFCQLGWTGESLLKRLRPVLHNASSVHPNLRFTIMANTDEDALLFRRNGFDAIWCNHNAFLDGRLFVPDPQAEKVYDAVYVA